MQNIKHSENLQAYLSSADRLQAEISPDMVQMIEEENETMESKVSEQRFAYLVLKNQYYNDLDAGMKKMNSNAKSEIYKIRDYEQHIYTLRHDDNEIKDALRKIILEVGTIDDKEI